MKHPNLQHLKKLSENTVRPIVQISHLESGESIRAWIDS